MNNSLKLPSIDYKEFKILTLCKSKEFANINHMAEELKKIRKFRLILMLKMREFYIY